MPEVPDKLDKSREQVKRSPLSNYISSEAPTSYVGPTPPGTIGVVPQGTPIEIQRDPKRVAKALRAAREFVKELSYREGGDDSINDTSALGIDHILKTLRNPTLDDEARARFVIDSERMRVPEGVRVELASILGQFIFDNRDSTEPERLVAVGSAIRKYVALMEIQRLGDLARLLEPGHNSALSLEAELEVIKMIGRKLAASPPTTDDQEPILADHLARIASDYLRPSVVSKGKFGTVAMLALEALAAMRSSRLKDLLPAVNTCPYAWFRRQLQRHLTKIDEQLHREGESCGWLARLISQIVVT